VVEDAQQFGERPKLDQFPDYIAVVVYGAGTNASLDRLDQRAITDAAGRVSTHNSLAAGPAAVFYQVADALTDSLFPAVTELDDRLDALQAEIIRAPRSSQLAELGVYRSALIPLHKVLTSQEEVFDSACCSGAAAG
jgi:Mg2+ and Co2+ transporter CorA